MLFQIKNRRNGSLIFELECGSLKICVEAAVKSKANLRAANLSDANLSAANLSAANLSDANLSAANLSDANLSAANLSAANLSAANLSAANLSAANLSDANLRAANLSAANLRAANLRDANLRAANLSAANLRAANLRDANLRDANLRDANLRAANLSAAKNVRLPTGELWSEYLSQTVPALLTAGGRPLTEVATSEHWGCHDWDNCPMAAAFNVKRIEDIPILYRPRAEQFVQLFDAKQIRLEDVLPKK